MKLGKPLISKATKRQKQANENILEIYLSKTFLTNTCLINDRPELIRKTTQFKTKFSHKSTILWNRTQKASTAKHYLIFTRISPNNLTSNK